MTRSSSPPITLSTELPTRRRDERFIDTGAPCEWGEEYRPGRFHPIHFGDTLNNGQYRVIRKLGYGSFSTVWLAVNSQSPPKYVALKVMMAKDSWPATPSPEIEIAGVLSASSGFGADHILKLLDTFQQPGPNGVHTCLVYEPMGGTVASLVGTLPGNRQEVGQPYRYITARYPKWMAKQILKHTLLGLAFLHRNDVVHSDLQPGNLLFTPRDLNDIPEADLTQSTTDDTTRALERKDGKVDKWGPRYLALGQSLHQYANLGEDMQIKVSDLGAGFFKGKPPAKIVTPVALRAPEIILKRPVDEKIDIWSFGCLVYELVTGTRLFPVDFLPLDTEEEADDDHFLALNDILGELPEDIAAGWGRKDLWFGPDGERLNPRAKKPQEEGEVANSNDNEMELSDNDMSEGGSEDEDGERRIDAQELGDINHGDGEDQDSEFEAVPEDYEWPSNGEEEYINTPTPSLEALFDEHKPDTIDDEEAKLVTTLIRRILRYDPAERPSAEELLAEKWFEDA